jgi:hypothetical protein
MFEKVALRSTIFHLRTAALLLGFPLACAGCATTLSGSSSEVDGAFIRAAQTWDLNHDGNVTCDEWRAYALSLFKEADKNRDGKLTPEEFAHLEKLDRLFGIADFKYYDTRGQGYITQADFVDRPNPAFLELDKDKTCVLKQNQLRAASQHAPKRENPGVPGSR